MTERDLFERDLADFLRTYAQDAPTDVRPAELAHRVAAAHPRGRGAFGRWSTGMAPALAWILLLAGLLLALMAGGLLAGAWRPDPALVTQGTSVLATTRARPLPALATCPPGSDPDAAGPADQDHLYRAEHASMAFDRHAGRIVALDSGTYTFDVCANTWQRMHPSARPPADDPVRLVYDADSDRTLGFASNGEVWSYDLEADSWTVAGQHPELGTPLFGWVSGIGAAYHDPSGLVMLYDGRSMWAYDAESDTLTEVTQRPDPSQPAGEGLPRDVTAVVYDPERDLALAAVAVPEGLRGSASSIRGSQTHKSLVDAALLEVWAFEPGTGAWRLQPTQLPAGVLWQQDGFFYGPVGRVAFDAASGVTAFLSSDGWVEVLAGQRSWRAHPDRETPATRSDSAGCDTLDPVYDPLNGRIVCQVAGGGVSAFSTATGTWRWLLEPEPAE